MAPQKVGQRSSKVFFQLGLEGNKLVVAYKTDQSEMLLNSATEFPFAFTQGGVSI